MKKSLLAVAAMTAFAGAAQAQSSVTVYGILDVGYVGKNVKDSPATAAGTNTSNSFSQSAETSSRLGFKGVEDLGGGLSAFFTVETGLTPNSSNFSGVNNRQSFVGLKKNGLGQAAIGTQYTVMHSAVSATDPGQSNNVLGSVIYPAGGNTGGQASADAAYTIRMSNTLTAKTDNFAGFTASAMYSLNNKNSAQTAATTGGTLNTSGWGVGLDYTWKKLYAVAAYQSLKSESDATTLQGIATTATYTYSTTAGVSVVPAFTGTNATDNQTYVGATYDFGILKAYAGWVNRKVTGNLNSNEYLNRNAQQLGVRSFITPKVEAWASLGNGRYRAFGADQPTANFTGYQLGSNYYLSKRTNLYGIFGSSQTSSVSTTGAASGNSYAVGVRHTF
ncbi:MAG: hypothetical protein RLZZ601_2015 [Pseudomonadota bacterium]|jgi:predicted porin